MNRTAIKLLIGGVILVGAVSYLAWAGMKEGWATYHLSVDAFLKDTQHHGQRVRLFGKVAEEGLASNPGRLSASFVLLGESGRVNVAYKGVVPDLFKAGAEVVVEGTLDKQGTFQSDVLMTKCASKYDSKEHPQNGGK